jgi:putative hemolysin
MALARFNLEEGGLSSKNITVRLAKSRGEIEAAQRLRYEVFYEECGAKPTEEMRATRMEISELDFVADHLIVLDTDLAEGEQVVGNYRLLRGDAAKRYGKFYSQDEFNIDKLLQSGENLLELGRSCVHQDYRTRPVLELLWQGIAEYVMHHEVRFLFGCPSFMGTTDPQSIANELSYLYHFHLAPENLRARTLDHLYVSMNLMPKEKVNEKAALANLPALIKSYLRIGVMVADGAFIDHQFNSVDVFVAFDMARLTERYKRHYERAIGGEFKQGKTGVTKTLVS